MVNRRGVSLSEIDLSKVGADSPLHQLAKTKAGGPRKAFRERNDEEHLAQVALFAWIDREKAALPALEMAFAIPNFAGHIGSLGMRKLVGGRAKASGRRAGVPDILLAVPRGGYAGLFIELKVPGGATTPEQRGWLAALRGHGYHALVCVGWEAARDAVLEYLGSPPYPKPQD